MTETGRIRWVQTKYGGWTGRVGTMEPWAFQIWQVDGPDSPWRLDSALLGQFGYHVDHPDPEALKSHAGRWLAEFISSFGAAFPAGPVVSRCECGGLASHRHGCRWRQGYGSLIEAVTDEPAPEPSPVAAREEAR